MSHPDELKAAGQLFEARRKVFPRKVDGVFRRLKWVIMAITLAVYYVTPWLRWDRGPFAPDQAVLIDLANLRFYMFAIEIWPHEFYYVTGLLVMAAIGLFLVTSAVGRAWCGYACPQTVWTDLFQHIERAIDGDHNAQIKLDRAPWGLAKAAKRVTKWSLWLFIAAATGGAWIFYFADAPTLARQFFGGEAPFVAYSTVAILTATTFVLGGFLREQVCMYMCPWPRIQGAMLDENSLVVTYKDWRGEPRTHGVKRSIDLLDTALASDKIGDCIDCNACVAVCPTGIDIREGSQIGCITCGLCIDACDQVMAKLDRPKRLIGYTTAADVTIARRGGAPLSPLKRLFRLRTIAYFLLWGSIGTLMLFAFGNRSRLDLAVLRDHNPAYVRLSDGTIRNGYLLKIRNMESRPRAFIVRVNDLPGAAMWREGGARATASNSVRVIAGADKVTPLRVFVTAKGEGAVSTAMAFSVTATDAQATTTSSQTTFERPQGSAQ